VRDLPQLPPKTNSGNVHSPAQQTTRPNGIRFARQHAIGSVHASPSSSCRLGRLRRRYSPPVNYRQCASFRLSAQDDAALKRNGPGCRHRISKSEVSRICADLDEEVGAFRDRSLAGIAYPYVFLDATYCKARVNRRVVSRRW
jgi:hypothetical protein